MSSLADLKKQAEAAAAALDEARAKAAAAADAFASQTGSLEASIDAYEAAEKAAQGFIKAQEKFIDASGRANAKAQELLTKGLGGGELASALKDVSEGFRIVADSGARVGTRMNALVGAFGIAARGAVGLVRQVVAVGDALSALSQRAHGGNITALSVAWERAKQQGTELGLAVFRLAETFHRINPVGQVLSAWFDSIVTNMDRARRAADTVHDVFRGLGRGLHAATGGAVGVARASEELKPNLAAVGGEAAHLAQKVSSADIATRQLKSGTQDLAAKFDAGQQAARGMADTLRSVKDAMHDLSFATREGETEVDSFVRSYTAARHALVQAGMERRNRRAVNRQLVAEARANHGRIDGVEVNGELISGVTNISNQDPNRDLRRQLNVARFEEYLLTNNADTLRGADVERRRGETTQHFLQRELQMRQNNVEVIRRQREELERLGQAELDARDAREADFRAWREQARERGRADGAALRAADAEGRALGDRARQVGRDMAYERDPGLQVASQFGLVRNELDNTMRAGQTFAQQFGGLVGGAFNSVTQAIGSHVMALVTGRETAGEALRGMAHDALSALAVESLQRALFNTAQGISFLAMQNYPGAAQAFASAGIFAGIAAVGGLGALATAPPQASAAGASASGVAPSARVSGSGAGGSQGGGGNTYVYHIDGHIYGADREFFEDVVGRAQQGNARRGTSPMRRAA